MWNQTLLDLLGKTLIQDYFQFSSFLIWLNNQANFLCAVEVWQCQLHELHVTLHFINNFFAIIHCLDISLDLTIINKVQNSGNKYTMEIISNKLRFKQK